MKYTITGNGYSGTFNGDKNFIKTARSILIDLRFTTQDLFKLKTAQDFINALENHNFNVETEVTVYDEAVDEAPHLGKYIREMENEENEERISELAKITKIKIDKDSRFATIIYHKTSSKSEKETTFRGYEEATDEFIKDFRQMSEHIISTLNFPEKWLCDMTTTGLSITWKEGNIMGMVITAQKVIVGLAAPLNINTPFIQVASYHLANDTCDDVYFDNQCEQLLEKVLADAKRYMNGEVMNKQQKLELG